MLHLHLNNIQYLTAKCLVFHNILFLTLKIESEHLTLVYIAKYQP